MDGKVYPGIIKEKASAQKEYDSTVSQGQEAGLVRYIAVLSCSSFGSPLAGARLNLESATSQQG